MYKIRKLAYVMLTIALLIVLTGCSSSETENENTASNAENTAGTSETKVATIEDFKNKLDQSGLQVSAETSKVGSMIGAEDQGYSYTINGTSIEVYKFDEASSDSLTKQNIKSAKENGTVTMPDFNNYELKGNYNKGLFVVTNVNAEHPDTDKIVSILNSL